jgi:ankyrin repeat protein
MPTRAVTMWALAMLVAAPFGAAASDQHLVDAVKKADPAGIRALLQKHVDVNEPEADGMTALHWAAQSDEVEAAALLIGAGANPKALTRYGVAPLALACHNGSPRMIDVLLRAGADVNAASPEGETALMIAARVGKVDALKLLLEHGADVNAQESWKKQSALMWAAGEGHTQAIAALLASGANLQARSKAGFTPLLFAVRNGHLEAAKLLVDRGAQPNDRVENAGPTQDRYGRKQTAADATTSALGMAVINAYYELAAMLLDRGADPNVADPRGSVLHALAFMRRPGSGNPPLPTGNLDTLDLARSLLAHGANPNARIAWKEIAFDRDLAATKLPPNIPVGRNFLSFVGASPFYLAAKHGDVALMRLLVEHGADPKLPTVQGVTPLMAAAGLGFWDGESPGPLTGVPESESIEAVRLTLDLGNDINAVANFGGPALEGDGATLIRRHPLNFMKYDGPHDAPLDVVPPKDSLGDMRWTGSTALHGAAMRGSNALVRFLVEHGAKLDARNTLGWTPLMCAEGIFVANTLKDWPETVALIETLMKERGLNPEQYNQASIGVAVSRVAQQP